MQQSYDQLIEKWSPVLNESSAGEIKDHHRKAVTAAILENQEKAMAEARSAESGFMTEAAPAGANTGSIGTWDPVLISLVRRAMPNLIAYDVCGVQPMNGPTGLIFAMKSRYGAGSTSSREALFNEAETNFSGVGTHDSDNVSGFNGIAPSGDSADALRAGGTGTGDTTANMEAYGSSGGAAFEEMGFTIEKQTVTAKSRALKAEYSLELAQDLKAIHGLNAEAELANILSTEILAEINREVIRTIYKTAEQGAVQNVATAGVFDLDIDSNGRWSVEKFKGLLFQIESDANAIGQQTRRGKGNILICSADVASALGMAGVLDYTPALAGNNALTGVDDTSSTLVGTLNGRIKVYVDPYSANVADKHFYVAGYKGTSPYDAGLFYCPYVPLQQVRAINPNTFQPKIGFKTRYGMVSNPFAQGLTQGSGVLTANTNKYYRRVQVANLM